MSCRACCCFVLISATGLFSGCGGSGEGGADRPDRVPATGVVLYKQQPVEGATVIFAPQDHTHSAAARIGPDGRFQLQTFEPGDGAVPGEFKVIISKTEVTAQATGQSDDAELPEPEQRSLLPQKYGSADSSGLTATVTEVGENDFTFELEGEISSGHGQAPRAASQE